MTGLEGLPSRLPILSLRLAQNTIVRGKMKQSKKGVHSSQHTRSITILAPAHQAVSPYYPEELMEYRKPAERNIRESSLLKECQKIKSEEGKTFPNFCFPFGFYYPLLKIKRNALFCLSSHALKIFVHLLLNLRVSR